MFFKGGTMMSLLTLVAFLVLVSIATVLYNGDQQQRAQKEQSLFWQKTFSILSSGEIFLRNMVDFSLDSNSNKNQLKLFNLNNNTSINVSNSVQTSSWWAQLLQAVKDEWNNGNQNKQIFLTRMDKLNMLSWQKTEIGIEITWQTKNNKEYKLPLPFKFWRW